MVILYKSHAPAQGCMYTSIVEAISLEYQQPHSHNKHTLLHPECKYTPLFNQVQGSGYEYHLYTHVPGNEYHYMYSCSSVRSQYQPWSHGCKCYIKKAKWSDTKLHGTCGKASLIPRRPFPLPVFASPAPRQTVVV